MRDPALTEMVAQKGVLPSAAAPRCEAALHSPAPLLATLTALLLSGLLPLVLIGATPDLAGSAFGGPLTLAVLAGARFAWIVGSRSRRLFEMVVWLFAYVFLGIAPLVQLRTGKDPGTTPGIDHAYDSSASWVALVGCLAIIAGSTLSARRLPAGTIAPRRPSILSPRRATLLSGIAVLLAAYYVSKVGLGPLFTGRYPLQDAQKEAWPDSATSAVVGATVAMSLLVAFMAQLQLARERRRGGRKYFSPLLWVTGVSLFACVNPISSPRYVFGTVLLAVLTAAGVCATPTRFRALSLGAVAALVLVFPVADYFRTGVLPGESKGDVLAALTTGDFDAFAQLNNTVNFVAQNGHTAGRQALGVFLFWVPRVLWPDKPVDTGILLANWRHYDFTNLSAPLWAEFYINGGWILLVAGMYVFGWYLRRWDDGAERQLQSGTPSLATCIIPFYMMIMLRGSLLQSMAFLSVTLLGILLVTRMPVRPLPVVGADQSLLRG